MRGEPDLSAYVLGELDAPEADRLRERERRDPGFAAEVSRLRDAVTRLEGLKPAQWELAAPPPLAFVPEPRERRGRVGSTLRGLARPLVMRPAFAAAAAAVLLALGVAGGALVASGGDDDTGGTRVALAPVGPSPTAARATATIKGDRMRVDASGLPPSGRERFYEVWMMRGPKALVSLGSFRVDRDGRADVTLPVIVDAKRFPIVDVSLEPADGDPSHSSVSVLRSKPIVS
jgi:anti-sigma-K factor RskA